MGRRGTALCLTLLAIGIGLAYARSLGVGFYFDDTYGISNNPAIRSLWNIPSFFVDPFAIWTDHTQVDLRPVLLLTYAVNYAISGIHPWSYHVFNLICHFVAAILVFVIVRDHLWRPSSEATIPAAAAALIFALAPVNSQPINYVWARSALLCTTLYLAAFLAFLRGRRAAGALCFSLALLTKAIAVTLPLMLLIQDFLYRDRVRYRTGAAYLRDWRRLAPLVLVPALLDVAYLAYRGAFLPAWAAQARQASGITPDTWFMTQWSALIYYVHLFVWPDTLSIDHDFPFTTSLLSPRAWLSLPVLVLWVTLALRAAKRYPIVTFATVWFFVTLAPESSFAPLAEAVNDHRPYIATSLGLSVLLVWLLDRATVRLGARARPTFVAACLLLSAAAVSFDRYRTWQWGDSLRLWQDTVRTSPNNVRAWVNAGQELMSRGELATARRYFERAREVGPGYAFVYMNLSVLEVHEGHLDAALGAANEAVRLRPDHDRTHFYLGRALEKLGRRGEALAAYEHALALNPRDTEAAEAAAQLARLAEDENDMGAGLYALRTLKDPEGAAARFRHVLARTPTHYGATYQLATALDLAGHPDEARPLWEKMLAMAEASHDEPVAEVARTRLARRP